jgi:DNA-nicking Smr family endonuclease
VPKRPPPLAPLEKRLRQRLARGSEAIDRRIDLHGLTQSDAHRALSRFLHSAQAGGAKTVLVVTGKGARSADGDLLAERGVLRRLVPQWLAQPENREIVLAFETAHAAHGGTGALYVRLRRARPGR